MDSATIVRKRETVWPEYRVSGIDNCEFQFGAGYHFSIYQTLADGNPDAAFHLHDFRFDEEGVTR